MNNPFTRFIALILVAACHQPMNAFAATKAPQATASKCDIQSTKQEENRSKKEYVSRICISKNAAIALKYVLKTNTISVDINNKNFRLLQIPRGYEPSAVGADEYIAFLPNHLQPYLDRDVVLYTTAVRTTSGNGMGQCGAGVEVSLHALDISKNNPRIISSFLIISCAQPYDVVSDGGNRKTSDGLFVTDGRLGIHFLFYEKRDTTIAVLSDDLKRLEFPGN